MTMQEKYNYIKEILSKPELSQKLEDIEHYCEQNKKFGLKFHWKRACEMLNASANTTQNERAIYESSFNTSINDIMKLLKEFGCI